MLGSVLSTPQNNKLRRQLSNLHYGRSLED